MCFAKSSAPAVVEPVIQQDPVVREKADAQSTKNVKKDVNKGAFAQNIKTTALGLEDSGKKTLLGE